MFLKVTFQNFNVLVLQIKSVSILQCRMYKCILFIAVDDSVLGIYSIIIVSCLFQLEEVRQHLGSLKRRHYVVLHGMTGCGKSCLAAAALDKKELVIEQFKVSIVDYSDCNM